MTHDEIVQKVTAIVSNRFSKLATNDIQLETPFKQLGADELDFVELWIDIEKVFGITISDEDDDKISTVQDLVTYIERQLS